MEKCTRCSLHRNEYNINCVPYYGPSHPEIIFLGEMFGEDESLSFLETGIPECFIGSAGKKLDELLALVGLKREEVGLLNSVRCAMKGNPTPTKKEMDQCFPYLFSDIQKLKPRLLICLGDSALYQATGRTGVSHNRKKLLWSDKLQIKTVVSFHPAAVLYDPARWDDLVNDFKLIPTFVNAEPYEYKNFEYEVLDTKEKVISFFNQNKYKLLYFDSEFTELDVYKADIRIVQFKFEGLDKVYLIERDLLLLIENELKELFDSSPVAGQDFAIDAKIINTHHGVFPKIWAWDTCLAEYVLEGVGGNDLTALVGKYSPEHYGYDEGVHKAGGAHKIKDKKTLYQYGTNDVGVLPIIHKQQREKLIKNNTLWLYENIILPANKVLTKMSLRGVLVDTEKVAEVDRVYEKRAGRALLKALSLPSVKECERHFRREFNPRSPQMIAWLLLEYYKLPVLQRTVKDNPSIGQKEMEIYSQKHKNEYCQIMDSYRSYCTLRDGFLSGLLLKLHNRVAHTTYSLHSTTTSRPNSKDPNLLNLPRIKEIRQCFVARPKYKFVYSDLSQMEMRLASMWYNDPALKAICNDTAKDIHSQVTAQAFGKTYEEVYEGYKKGDPQWTELRVAGKTIGFGILYQEGDEALAYQLNISVEKAKKLKDSFYNNFPNLRDNIENTKKLVVKQGYIDNFFNFRRRWKFHSVDDHATLREAVNFPIQSCGFQLLALAMIKVDDELEKRKLISKLIMQVYDSILVEALEEEVDEVIEIVREAMVNVNKPFDGINDVALVSDVKVGDRLSDF